MKGIYYLVIYDNGHEEGYWVNSWEDFLIILKPDITRLGLPKLIYRKE